MKKTVKIIAFVLLLALAGLCLYKTIYYIVDGYYTIYSYFHILIKSHFSDPKHQEHAFSILGIVITCLLNFCYYMLVAIYILKPCLFMKPIKSNESAMDKKTI